MAYTLGSKCAKNLCKRIVLLQLIIENVVTCFFGTQCSTGWLKLKYPTGQNAISRQACEIFIPKFIGLYGRDPATILNFFKIALIFSKVMAI